MGLSDVIRIVQVLVIVTASQIQQVLSEYCGADLNCYYPKKCCENGITCCYDNDRNDQFSVYKLHVWNMWYFWFIIIFIMMSCFGGCGYYRRKRMATISRMQLQHSRAGGIASSVDCNNRTRHHSQSQQHPNYMAYTGPGLDTESTFLPPPYSEVVSQPDMYPPNKSYLPPYPGAPVITADNTGTGNSTLTLNVHDLNSEVPQPPSYNDVISMSQNTANQTSGDLNSTNQTPSSETNQSQAVGGTTASI